MWWFQFCWVDLASACFYDVPFYDLYCPFLQPYPETHGKQLHKTLYCETASKDRVHVVEIHSHHYGLLVVLKIKV